MKEAKAGGIKRLKFDGLTYNPYVKDRLGSFYFDSDDCEDDYVRISPIINNDLNYVITFVKGCEDRKMFVSQIDTTNELNIKNFELFVNREIASL